MPLRYSNCLIWAVCKFLREGGYIAARPSHHWRWIPHFIWSKDLKEWHGFVPLNPKNGPIAKLFCWWFKGEVVKEEAE